jgi:hypothetical protein
MDQITVIDNPDLKAIEMKYLGFSYAKIAEAVGVEYSTIKSWFMRSGRLYRQYLEYAIEATKDRKDNAKQLFAVSIDKAVRTMTELLDSQDERIRFIAAREIIERQHLDEEPISLDELHEVKILDLMEVLKRSEEEEEKKKLAEPTTATV